MQRASIGTSVGSGGIDECFQRDFFFVEGARSFAVDVRLVRSRLGPGFVEGRVNANHDKAFALLEGREPQHFQERGAPVLGIVGQENNSAERLRFLFRLGEKHDRTSRFPHQRPRDVPEERPQHDFLLQGACHQKIDFVCR